MVVELESYKPFGKEEPLMKRLIQVGKDVKARRARVEMKYDSL